MKGRKWPWDDLGSWALPDWDFGIMDEATDLLSLKALSFVAVSRARTTLEERRAIVARVRELDPPLRRGKPSLREVVRLDLVARGLFPPDRPLAGDELPVGPDGEPY